jgi:thiol-disulfide isomerase/thioredoxin/uncharacterized membrane protein YphA (DoxX/SURF4 family)
MEDCSCIPFIPMDVFLLILRLFLFAIFAVAGIGKFFDLKGSQKAIEDFGVPESLSKSFAWLLPSAEIIVAILLLPTTTSWFASIGAFVLLMIFIVGMIVQIRQGNAPDCHCFGAIHSEPVSAKSLIRNVLFAVAALALIISGQTQQGISAVEWLENVSSADRAFLVLGLLISALLGFVVYYLKNLIEGQKLLGRQIEVMQFIANDGTQETVSEDFSHPQDGLPIGSPMPDFELPDLNGKIVSFEHLLMQGKPMLFFFVGPNCNPCKGLQPEFDQWQTEFGDKFNLIFISSGKAKDNIEKFGDQRTMLLQKDFEVGKLINAMWTPTAVLINSDGTIGSRLAASDDEVRQLIEQLRGEIEKGEPYFVKNSENIRQSEAKLGEEIPQFSLEAINGKTLTSKDLQGKKTLVAFWSTSCGWCDLMMEELRDWDKMKGVDEPNLLLFSNGETDKNLEFDFASPILLDEKDEITKQFGKNGTPSAVLINEDGKIISETAVGANQIWALLGKSKK